MRGLDRRLGQVERVARRRERAVAHLQYDGSDLTPYEQYELDMLLARAGAAFPHETWAQVPLIPGEQGRLEALVARIRVVEHGARRRE